MCEHRITTVRLKQHRETMHFRSSNVLFAIATVLLLGLCVKPVISGCEPNGLAPLIVEHGARIEESESKVKYAFQDVERLIRTAKDNASLFAEIRSAQGLPGSALAVNIGNILAQAHCHPPVMFRYPRVTTNFTTPDSPSRSSAPLCGLEIQKMACTLLGFHNDRRVFLSPFDLDELLSPETRDSAAWHRNSPLWSIMRLCFGHKAVNKNATAETCIGSLILEKLLKLINDHAAKSFAKQTGILSSDQSVSVIISNRYLIVKAILMNYGYANQGIAAEHGTGNAIDFMCGASAGLDSDAERNCTAIGELCLASTSTSVNPQAEKNGCGTESSPLTSVHCAFFTRPVINLGNMTVTQVTEAIQQHYEPYDKQTKAIIDDAVEDTVKKAVAQKLPPAEAIKMLKSQIAPKLYDVIVDSYENGIVFNVSTMPQRNSRVIFKKISFRIASGNSAIDNLLSRGSRQAELSECPSASVDMARRLLDLYSVGGKVVFLPSIFSKYNASAIFETVSSSISTQSDTQESDSASDGMLKRFVNAKAALRWQINAGPAKPPSTTTRSTTRASTSTTTTTTTTKPSTSTASDSETTVANTEAKPTGALENIVRLALGYKAFNSDGNTTCISYESLLGIFKLANDFFDKYRQPLYVAALSGTEYHIGSTEAQTHNDGVAVDSLCGMVYPRAAQTSPTQVVDDKSQYCSEITSGCYQTAMFGHAELGATSSCLSSSILQVYGIVHCRSRQ